MKKCFTLLFIFCLTTMISFAQTATQPSGDGTEASPYQIATLDNLYWLSQADTAWDKHYIQTGNIDASSSSSWNGGKGFSPIGNASTKFTGSFNGQGYTIEGLYLSYPDKENVGLFGYTTDATISGIEVINSSISVTNGNYVGGIIGSALRGTMSRCSFTGNISFSNYGHYLGGLIGAAEDVTIMYCFTNSTINGNAYCGGLIGSVEGCTVSNCYATGNLNATNFAGGLIGFCVYSAVVNKCYSSVKLGSEISSSVGLLIGCLQSTCRNSFWNKETSVITYGFGEVTYSTLTNNTGITTAQMKDYGIFSAAGWDLMNETANGSGDYWGLNANKNDGTPFLFFQPYTNNPAPIIDSISDRQASSVTVNFRIPAVASPINQHGICWNTSDYPTLSDHYTNEGSVTASGNYTSSLTGLEKGVTYYARAYTINATDIAYSPSISFQSLRLPDISTLLVKNITDSLATVNITVSDLGIPSPAACGICWNTTGSPTINDGQNDLGAINKTGTYSVGITNLTYNTRYYVRAFATNELGTVYGNELNFVAQNAFLLSSVDTLFFNTIIGEMATNSFYVKNTGEAALVIDSIKIANPFFSVNNSSATINAGDSLLFILTYNSGTITADTLPLIIYSNAAADTIYTQINTSYKKAVNAGNALSFDGSNDDINLGSPNALDNLAMDNFSIDMWINTSDISTRSVLFGNFGDNPSINLEIHTDNGGGVLRTYLNGVSFMDDQSIADGQWHHIATVVNFDDDYVKMYIDGVESFSGTGLPDKYSMSRNFYLGRDARTSTHYYAGQMDEVRIWNKALTQAEIRSQYSSLAGNEDGLLAYWRMDEQNGNTIYDATNNGLSGTLNGASRIIPSTAPIADPVFTVMPEKLAFGSLFYSEKDTITFKIANSGGGILHIDSLNYDMTNFKINPASINIFSGDTTEFEAVFIPDTTGNFTGYLIYNHNMGKDSSFVEAYCVGLPYFSLTGIDSIKGTSALAHLHVDTIGTPAPKQFGICWNKTGSPTLNDTYINEGAMADTGIFKLDITELQPITQYYVKAYLVNGTIITYSNEISFTTTKITPVITWATPESITYGTALSNIQFNATVEDEGSTIAGTFMYVPDVGSVLDAGTRSLNVTFIPSNTVIYSEASATTDLVVEKVALAVGVENETIEKGTTIPDFTITYSGFVNSEDENVLDTRPTATCSATTQSVAGDYAIVVGGGDDNNYEMNYTNGTLTVTPLTSVISEKFANVLVYPNPVFEVVYISMGETSKVTNYKLVSINGTLVTAGTLVNGRGSINMSMLESGIYFLNLAQDNKEMNYKIIKE